MKYSKNKGYKKARRKMARSARQSNKKPTPYVAVVVGQAGVYLPLQMSLSHPSWSCFIGTDEKAVVEAALKAREAGRNGPYRILAGTLTEEVVAPTVYQMVKL